MMTDESDVRAWLATAEVPDLRTDLQQAVADGRVKARQRRVQRIATAGALTLAVLVAVPGVIALADHDRTHPAPGAPAASGSASAAASAPVSRNPNACEYHALTAPDDPAVKALTDPEVMVAAVDPSGRYAVGSVRQGRDEKTSLLLLWDNGKARLLPPETKGGYAIAVNERGEVLGKSGLNEYGALGSFVYRNGSIVKLGIPSDAAGHDLAGITPAGDVVGYLAFAGGRELQARPAVWPAGRLGTPQWLPDPPNGTWSADRVGTDGTILGSLWPGLGPYVFANGKGTALTGTGDDRLADANGDWVVGTATATGKITRWRISTGEVITVTVPNVPDFWAENVRVRGDGTVVAVGRQQKTFAANTGPLLVVRGDRAKELPAPAGRWAGGLSANLDGTVVYGDTNAVVTRGGTTPPGYFPQPAYWTC